MGLRMYKMPGFAIACIGECATAVGTTALDAATEVAADVGRSGDGCNRWKLMNVIAWRLTPPTRKTWAGCHNNRPT